MKKSFTFLIFLFAYSIVSAQLRTSLYEGFSGENCGPCSSSDTLLNGILSANSSQIIPIIWETAILTAPNNPNSIYQTNKGEINWRYRSSTGNTLTAGPSTLAYGYPSQNTATHVATNGVNVAPTGRIDGQHQWAFGATSDHPSDLDNSVISNAQSQSTNFRLSMTPNWNPSFSNCVVTVTIMSTNSFTALGALMFRLCLVERSISFNLPTGINGQKVFYDAVRKSYPTTLAGSSVISMGTLLPNNWAPSQTLTLSITCNIPAYIRDLSQMAFVGFIQDDGDRKIYQAARTAQPAIPNDIKVISANVPLSCSGTYTPSFIAENLGPIAVTALTITPYLDGSMQNNYNYIGNIPGNSTVSISLPTYTATYGKHSFSMTITGVSGGDLNPINNTIRRAFGVSNTLTTSVTESFASFPPPNWYALDYDFGNASWAYASAGGFSNSIGSAKYDFWNNYLYGDTDELFLPKQDFSGETSIILSFDVAYAQYSSSSDDKLSVLTSTDCGATWNNAYSKQGSSLATAPSKSISPFVPTATEWRRDTVYLNSLANQSSVLVKFSVIAGYGNNLYLDNVNIGKPGTTATVTSLDEAIQSQVSINVFPNPSSGLIELQISLYKQELADIDIMNSLGQTIYSAKNKQFSAGANTMLLDLEDFSSGVYFVKVFTANSVLNSKLYISK